MSEKCHVGGRSSVSPAHLGPHIVEAPFTCPGCTLCPNGGEHRVTNCSQCGSDIELPAVLPEGIILTDHYEEYLRKPNLAGSQIHNGSSSYLLDVHPPRDRSGGLRDTKTEEPS